MKIRQKLLNAGSFAVLTASVFLGGCSTPGSSLFKTATEQSILNWSTGNYEEAIHYADKALKKNPKDSYAMMVAALSYDGLGYPHKSRRYYEDIVLQDTQDMGVFGAVRNMPPEELKKAATTHLKQMEDKSRPFAVVRPDTHMAIFTDDAFTGSNVPVKVTVTEIPTATGTVAIAAGPKTEVIKGGLDMLSEGDRNVIQRYLTFIRLRDEKYVTEDEWLTRRSVNLGGLLPYTLTSAGLGMDLPSPEGDVIIARLNALRNALEMRAITPREHAAEREVILEALLPSNPFYRMDPIAPPQDVLEGATALRRIEMLKNLKLITPDEAKKEAAAIEKLIYAKLGMAGDGKSNPAAAKCIQKCLSAPANLCPPAAKPAAKKTTTVKKKAASPAKKPVEPVPNKMCPCP